MEAAGAVDAQNAPTAPWKTHRTRFPQLPQASHKSVTDVLTSKTVTHVLAPRTLAVPRAAGATLKGRPTRILKRTLNQVTRILLPWFPRPRRRTACRRLHT